MTAEFPTPLSPTDRYLPVDVRRIYFLPTIATLATPTRTEIAAGTDLTAEVVASGVDGFSLDGATVDVPDLGSIFTANIPGRQSVATSSIKLYADSASSDARTVFVAVTPSAPATTGFILILEEGEYEAEMTKLMDIWPVRVISTAIDQDTETGGQMTVTFAIPSRPALNVEIPTTS